MKYKAVIVSGHLESRYSFEAESLIAAAIKAQQEAVRQWLELKIEEKPLVVSLKVD